MSVRNCGELGKNLQSITKRLLANQTLCKLLYYTDKDPLAQPDITDTSKIMGKQISIIPQNNPVETAEAKVVMVVANGSRLGGNDEFREILIRFYIYTPITQWIIRNENLRPFLIMQELENSLHDKNINGLGKMKSSDFNIVTMTEQMTIYVMDFSITEFA